jgi:transmembrane sensor
MSQQPASPEHRPAGADPSVAKGETALAWAVGTGRSNDVMREVSAQIRRTQRTRLRLAAAGVTAAALVAVSIFWPPRPQAGTGLPLRTASAVVSQPETQLLPDGSIVELNRGAHVTATFTADGDGVRRVVLDRGEAHFQVRKNPLRPFIVVAAGVEVRAVGTAFAVQLGAQSVEVLVTEGRVAVDQPPANPPPSTGAPATPATPEPLAFVNAGHRVQVELAAVPAASLAPPPPVLAVTETELRDRLAWRVPLLEFSGTPLAEVIPMFNRHNAGHVQTPLVLADPALGEFQVSGVLRADNIASLLRLLQTEFGIVAESRDGSTFLRRP